MGTSALVTFISGIVAFINGLYQVSVGYTYNRPYIALLGMVFVILGAGFTGYGAYVLSVS